jgi:hypothetical protein
MIFLSISIAAEPCSFFGTLEINGIEVDSIMVTAHNTETDEFLVSGWEGIEKGQYYLEVNETGDDSKIAFKIMGKPVDQSPQLCVSGESIKLNLTAIACTDCDEDGFPSLLWGGNDCDDRNPEANPDKSEICGNGIDEDCNGLDSTCSTCQENWVCTPWSDCVNGEQSRACIDEEECGTTNDKPAQAQVCNIFNAGIICTDGEFICEDDLRMECFAGRWRQVEVCQFGCIEGECSSGGITGLIVANSTAFWGVMIVIMLILVCAAYWRARY